VVVVVFVVALVLLVVVVAVVGPHLWSSGQSFWLQIEFPGSIPGATKFSE